MRQVNYGWERVRLILTIGEDELGASQHHSITATFRDGKDK